MYYAIYKITNKIDGKIYIGSHKTKNLEDSYMGSGKYLKHAIAKYGVENFDKTILHVYDNPGDMYAKESEIVNEDFIAFENTYNIKVGGYGGWDFVNDNGLYGFSDTELAKRGRLLADARLVEKYGEDWRFFVQSNRDPESRKISAAKATHTKSANGIIPKTEQLNTEEANKKKRETFSRIKHQSGESNSQYGKMWITNGEDSKTILKGSPIPEGWFPGRKMNKSG